MVLPDWIYIDEVLHRSAGNEYFVQKLRYTWFQRLRLSERAAVVMGGWEIWSDCEKKADSVGEPATVCAFFSIYVPRVINCPWVNSSSIMGLISSGILEKIRLCCRNPFEILQFLGMLNAVSSGKIQIEHCCIVWDESSLRVGGLSLDCVLRVLQFWKTITSLDVHFHLLPNDVDGTLFLGSLPHFRDSLCELHLPEMMLDSASLRYLPNLTKLWVKRIKYGTVPLNLGKLKELCTVKTWGVRWNAMVIEKCENFDILPMVLTHFFQ